jgi:uncharacterized protein YcbK (DUF882 family)
LIVAPLAGVFLPSQTENAVANGDTRTLTIYHVHTKETTTVTFRVNGMYDPAALEKLNWALRDWRRDEPTKMDPRLFDVVWEVYREAGSTQPIWIMSAYRSPETNAMLRRRSRAVAQFSQHMLGKAMDVHFADMPMQKVRDIAMRLQRGGVGYYPTAGTPFVHIDVGGVRYWPRMSYDEMARIFPDGKTVDIPSNGQKLARYDEALADIQARGGVAYSATVSGSGNLLSSLFGGGEDEEGAAATAAPAPSRQFASVDSVEHGHNFQGSPSPSLPQSGSQQVAVPAAAPARPAIPPKDAPKPQVVPEVVAQETTEPAAPPTLEASLVPMPPRRPAELVAANFDPVPVPPSRPVDLAPGPNAIDSAPTASVAAKLASALPVPSRAAAAPAAPSAAVDPSAPAPMDASRVADNVPLPSVITEGTSQPTRQAGVLAFAEVPPTRSVVVPPRPPAPLAPTASLAPTAPAAAAPLAPSRPAAVVRLKPHKPMLVAATIDRSNFRVLTASASTAHEKTYAALGSGSALAPLRPAARVDAEAIMFGSAGDAVAKFRRTANPSLEPDHFSGQAIRALSVADGFVTLRDTSFE